MKNLIDKHYFSSLYYKQEKIKIRTEILKILFPFIVNFKIMLICQELVMLSIEICNGNKIDYEDFLKLQDCNKFFKFF